MEKYYVMKCGAKNINIKQLKEPLSRMTWIQDLNNI